MLSIYEYSHDTNLSIDYSNNVLILIQKCEIKGHVSLSNVLG